MSWLPRASSLPGDLGESLSADFTVHSQLQAPNRHGDKGNFGKPQGTVAGAHIGQVITSICTKQQNKELATVSAQGQVQVPGHQKMLLSQEWALPSLMQMLKSASSRMDVGVVCIPD